MISCYCSHTPCLHSRVPIVPMTVATVSPVPMSKGYSSSWVCSGLSESTLYSVLQNRGPPRVGQQSSGCRGQLPVPGHF